MGFGTAAAMADHHGQCPSALPVMAVLETAIQASCFLRAGAGMNYGPGYLVFTRVFVVVLTMHTRLRYYLVLKTQPSIAEVNIHLRARTQDRALIDQAAELVGANRSQFMMASALKEAKNILLDQTTLYADAKTFQKVMDWMDAPATRSETAGMQRLLQAKTPWQSE